ncbi:MAG: RecQ family ATP-dependent DNA helicase, partial [bacterium]
ISPLVSLMKDQVMALREQGVPAAALYGGLSAEEGRETFFALREGELKLLYVAPERLLLEGFLRSLRAVPVSLVAVDEAHCISQWGQDFRPSYLHIPDFLAQLPQRPPVAAFTATATAAVREDAARLLGLREPLLVTTGFDRPNLFFDVLPTRDKSGALLRLLREREGRAGIVYCATRAKVEEVTDMLNQNGIAATRYHAGLEPAERANNQEDFVFDRKSVMVATNAFGMGIDKSNVSFVIHYNMPKSIEAYYQEAGRAGRDGAPADCVLLYSRGDVHTNLYLIEHSGDNDELTEEERAAVQEADRKRLDAMIAYCKSERCLRGAILDYFGQPHAEHCGNCGVCAGRYPTSDITREAQMVLSCVKRIKDSLGYSVGASLVVDTLKGSGGRTVEKGLDELSTFGLMRSLKKEEIFLYVDALVDKGYLQKEPEFQTLIVTQKAGNVLFRGEKVTLRVREKPPKKAEAPRKPAPTAGVVDEKLFAALRDLRTAIAREEGVPLYVVFSNATLAAISNFRPHSAEEFLAVPGVGNLKLQKYGARFLELIRKEEKN